MFAEGSSVEKVNGQASKPISGTPVLLQCPSVSHLLNPQQVAEAQAAGDTVPKEIDFAALATEALETLGKIVTPTLSIGRNVLPR